MRSASPSCDVNVDYPFADLSHDYVRIHKHGASPRDRVASPLLARVGRRVRRAFDVRVRPRGQLLFAVASLRVPAHARPLLRHSARPSLVPLSGAGSLRSRLSRPPSVPCRAPRMASASFASGAGACVDFHPAVHTLMCALGHSHRLVSVLIVRGAPASRTLSLAPPTTATLLDTKHSLPLRDRAHRSLASQ